MCSILCLGTQFFRPFCPAWGGRWWLRRGRPARDQYESSCPGSSYPAGLIVFGLRLTSTALVFLLAVGHPRVWRSVMFARRRFCKHGTKLKCHKKNLFANPATDNRIHYIFIIRGYVYYLCILKVAKFKTWIIHRMFIINFFLEECRVFVWSVGTL